MSSNFLAEGFPLLTNEIIAKWELWNLKTIANKMAICLYLFNSILKDVAILAFIVLCVLLHKGSQIP
jgi:hypothetical protein